MRRLLSIKGSSRILRLEQSSMQFKAYYLVARDTLEENLARVIEEKQHVLNEILDGDDSAVDLDIFDRLTKEILTGAQKCQNSKKSKSPFRAVG